MWTLSAFREVSFRFSSIVSILALGKTVLFVAGAVAALGTSCPAVTGVSLEPSTASPCLSASVVESGETFSLEKSMDPVENRDDFGDPLF